METGENQAKKIERIRELVPILSRAAKAYYADDTEIMSNLEYDKLYDELVSLERETGFVLASSPTGKNRSGMNEGDNGEKPHEC